MYSYVHLHDVSNAFLNNNLLNDQQFVCSVEAFLQPVWLCPFQDTAEILVVVGQSWLFRMVYRLHWIIARRSWNVSKFLLVFDICFVVVVGHFRLILQLLPLLLQPITVTLFVSWKAGWIPKEVMA